MHGFVVVADVSYYISGSTLVAAAARIGTIMAGDALDVELLVNKFEGPRRLPKVSRLRRAC